MKKIRILSAILAMAILVAAFSLPVGAVSIDSYTSTSYTEAEAKVETMTSVYKSEEYGYEMFMDLLSGEFAIKDLKTGKYTFSNPYDVAVNSTITDIKKQALLSQILVKYTDTVTAATSYLGSFTSAALLGDQIEVKRIADGIRVEYAIGTVESKRLVPRMIEKGRFEELIYKKLESLLDSKAVTLTDEERFVIENIYKSSYTLVDLSKETIENTIQTLKNAYPVLQTNPELKFYVINDNSEKTLKRIEDLIRNYCPEYTFDELEYDHELTGYEGTEKEPPLFRLAVEYTFDENGFSAAVPAKSIRYNETNYTLDSITILPYFGCSTVKEVGGRKTTGGYLFLPDGSGTILEYYNNDGSIKTGAQNISVYGIDYAYEDLSAANNTANAQVCRMPVFGLTDYYTTTEEVIRSGRPNMITSSSDRTGYVAIIEEGESLATITASLGTMLWTNLAIGECEYNTVYASFSMQQTDKVSLGSSLGGGSGISKSIDTRYTGNYTIRYILLGDSEDAAEEPTYVGMASAYRNYLISTGAIAKFSAEELKSQLPLYIQTLGSMRVQDTFLTFPVTVTKALTSFDDIKAMTKTLGDSGVDNIKYILTGYANGTASYSDYPTYVKFNSKVGGNKGYKDLVDFSIDEGVEILPNFDFANVRRAGSGFKYKKHAALTMTDRYATKRDYDSVTQAIESFGRVNIVSTGAYDYIYSKFAKSFDKLFKDFDGYNGALAALTLGTDLNSDFDAEDPITREDSKNNTVDFIDALYQNYDAVLVEGGNAYTIPYVTDIISVPLDNSNYAISTAAVPFMGIVLHGCIDYSGSALNMAGDVMYEVLKSIENGASPYFLLAYKNVEELKNVGGKLSDYYSVNFETWESDVVKYYNMLNEAIGDLQNAVITDHAVVTAFKTNTKADAGNEADEANMLFAELKAAAALVESTSKAYYAAVEETDKIVSDQKNADVALAAENAAKTAFTNAKTRLSLVQNLIKRNSVANVVFVTYKADSGKTKTFFINYNNYDVAIEDSNGNAYVLAGMSFVESAEVNGVSNKIANREDVTAFVPATTDLAEFASVNETLEKAVASGNANSIKRAKEAMQLVLDQIRTTTTNVAKITDNNGDIVYINYETSAVVVKISDTEYQLIAAQSYLIND